MLPVAVSPAALPGAAPAGDALSGAAGAAQGFADVLAEACDGGCTAAEARSDDSSAVPEQSVERAAIWRAGGACLSLPEIEAADAAEDAEPDAAGADSTGGTPTIESEGAARGAVSPASDDALDLPPETTPFTAPILQPVDGAVTGPSGADLPRTTDAPNHAAAGGAGATPVAHGRAAFDRAVDAQPAPESLSPPGRHDAAEPPVAPSRSGGQAAVAGEEPGEAVADGHEAIRTRSDAREPRTPMTRMPEAPTSGIVETPDPHRVAGPAAQARPAEAPGTSPAITAVTSPVERSVRDGTQDAALEQDAADAQEGSDAGTERVPVSRQSSGGDRGQQAPYDASGTPGSGDRGATRTTRSGVAIAQALESQPASSLTPGTAPSRSAGQTASRYQETFDRLVQTFRLMVRDGITEARVRLRPEHLGDVSIAIRVDGRSVTATVFAESASVRDWLHTQEDAMRASLSQHGLTLDRLVVHRDAYHERREHEQPQSQPRRPRPPREGEEPARFDVSV